MPTTVSLTANTVSQATFAGNRGCSVTLRPTGGRSRIEYTTDSPAAVLNNAASWLTWPNGSVTEESTDTLTQTVGLRLVCETGTAVMEIGDAQELCPDDPALVWLTDARVKLRTELTSTLLPEVGPVPIYYRDTASSVQNYVTDSNGILRLTQVNEALFWGSRRMENLCRYSEFLTFTDINGWSAVNSCTVAAGGTSANAGPDGNQTAWLITRANATANSILRSRDTYTLRAVPHTFSVWLKAGTATTAELRIYIPAGATLVTQIVNVTSTWQRFAISGTPDGTSGYAYSIAAGSWASGASVTVLAAFPQLEEIVGTSNVAPSEYVPRDSYPANSYWYGAGADGVRYLSTAKANTLNVSTGVVTQSTGASLTTAQGIATFPSVQQFFLNTQTLSTATTSAATITTGSTAGPDGALTGILLAEDTTTAQHFVSQTLTGTNTYDSKWATYSVYAKYRGASTGRSWIQLAMVDIDGGTVKSCFFNIETGTVGTATHGTGYVETLADGWFRCIWSAIPIGAGASDAVARIYLSTDGSTTNYLGASRGVFLFGPNFTSALSAASISDKPLPVPFAHTAGTAVTIPGSLIIYEVEGLIGLTDFAIVSDYTPYFIPSQTNKRVYTAVTYFRTVAPVQNFASVGARDFDRCGLTLRPNNGAGSVHTSKWAWDFYGGEINNDWYWRPSTFYNVGNIAIPLATLPDNASPTQKMFTCVISGTSGNSEPTWVNTFTTPPNTTSNLTLDGSVRWQCNEDNGILGEWEPYLGAHLIPQRGFMQTTRLSWFMSASDYGCFENGTDFVKQTLDLFDNGFRTVLQYQPKLLYLGNFGSNKGIPPGAIGSATTAELMSIHTAFHKNVRLYNARMTREEVSALSTS